MNDNLTKETDYSRSFLVLQELPINWKWMLFLGVLMVLLGTLGLVASGFLTLTSMLMFGGFIFAGGIIQMIHTVMAKEKDWGGKVQHILIALLYIVAGLIIFWDPFATSLIVTILLASLFAVIGGTKIWYAFYCKKQDWKWLLPAFSGLLNLVLTAIIITTLPESAIWLIGLLIAIEMLFSGWFLLLLGLRMRKIEKNGQPI
ncbi:MAG: HdeD family acid-resistance protein [Methylococcaceae bacterium]|nr:HdeD family acid-resistance protein [Methylococcaceae bacterium]